MPGTAERLRRIRRLYRSRGSGPRRQDLAFTVYATALALVVAVVPVVRAILLALTEEGAIGALTGASAPHTASVVAGGVLALSTWAGAVRGPAELSPFFAATAGSADLPRRRVLLRPFLLGTAGVVGLLVAVAALLGAALLSAGAASLPAVAAFCAGAAALAIVASTLWLLGQRLGPARAWLPSVIVLAATLATAVAAPVAAYTPWGWLGLLYPAHEPEAAGPSAALALAAVAAASCAPRLLDSLSGPELLSQARRWESATTAAISGDTSLALATFRPLPGTGRRWKAVSAAASPAAFLRRDAVGAARTPVRAASAALVLLVAGAAMGAAMSAVGAPFAVVAGAIGAVCAYLALGAFSDGLRHAAEAAGAPPLYGITQRRLTAVHSLFPLVAALATLLGGCVIAGAGDSPAALAATVAVALTVVGLRLFDSAKGPLPLSLLTPIPTPFGDLSGLVVLSWQADALLLAAASGAAIVLAWASGPAPGVLVVVLALATIGLLARRRLRS